MMKLSIKNQKPLVKVGKRGHYTRAEKQELMNIPKNENVSLHLKALAAKFNRSYLNVRNYYYRMQADAKAIVESNIISTIPKRTVEEVDISKHNSVVNAWSEFETNLLIEAMEASDNKKATSIELSELIDRTPTAIMARWRYVQDKGIKISHTEQHYVESPTKLDTSFIGIPKESPSFIPETPTDLFLEEVSVTMYKALDGSLHEKAQDAVKANIRTIIDSIPDKDSDDRTMHLWFVENKEKVNYLTNINVEELW